VSRPPYPDGVFVMRVFFGLALGVAIGWGWPSRAQAQHVATGPEDCGKSPYVLVADNSSCEEGVRTAEMIVHGLAQARAETVEVKARAPRKRVRGKPPTETGVSVETKRRLDELLLLDVLRSAGQR